MNLAYRHLVKVPNGATEIAGRGIRVYTMLCNHESGDSVEELASDFDLPLGAVYEALAYAADHPEEMNEIRIIEAEIERDLMAKGEKMIEEGRKRRLGTALP